jgi:hypothetical protein
MPAWAAQGEGCEPDSLGGRQINLGALAAVLREEVRRAHEEQLLHAERRGRAVRLPFRVDGLQDGGGDAGLLPPMALRRCGGAAARVMERARERRPGGGGPGACQDQAARRELGRDERSATPCRILTTFPMAPGRRRKWLGGGCRRRSTSSMGRRPPRSRRRSRSQRSAPRRAAASPSCSHSSHSSPSLSPMAITSRGHPPWWIRSGGASLASRGASPTRSSTSWRPPSRAAGAGLAGGCGANCTRSPTSMACGGGACRPCSALRAATSSQRTCPPRPQPPSPIQLSPLHPRPDCNPPLRGARKATIVREVAPRGERERVKGERVGCAARPARGTEGDRQGTAALGGRLGSALPELPLISKLPSA